MSKNAIIEHVQDKTGITKNEAGIVASVVFEGIINEILNNKKVILKNLGTIYVKKVAAKTARNPRTGETVNVPTKNVLRFRPSVNLKDKI